jgi:YtkA-like
MTTPPLPPMKTRTARRAGVVLVVMAAVGCGSPASTVDDASTGPLYSCSAETRAVQYMPNLERTSASGKYKGILVESVPAPPAHGSDTWTVKIVDANDVAQDGLPMTASPYMPDHRHPTTVKATVTPVGGGTYTVTPVYFFMPGYWEITFKLHPDDDPMDGVVFPICIPG